MSPLDVADTKVADPHDGTVAYVPPLERTAGQPEPIAAHGGLSYMAFARDGDAGTAVALDDALAEIASGESQRLTDMLDKAPPGGVALPLPYTVYERPSYSVVPSNAIWRDPARAETAMILRTNERGNR